MWSTNNNSKQKQKQIATTKKYDTEKEKILQILQS